MAIMDFTRDELRTLHDRSKVVGAAIFLLDCLLYGLAIAGVIYFDSLLVRLIFSLVAGVATGMLFVVGHDACHHSLTPSRALNRLIGTIAFLPSLTPYSLWDLSHNRIHHRWTNRRGYDYAWEPLTHDEFRLLSPWARRQYQFFRTPFGHFWYYLVEVWGKRMFFPRRAVIGDYRPEYVADLAISSIWAVAWSAILIALWRLRHPESGASGAALVVLLGFVGPWLLYKALISFAIYLHHTHPNIEWMPRDREVDSSSQIRSTVHVVFPPLFNWIFHSIMDHTAHHLRPGIPCYKLPQGQRTIEERAPGVIIHHWSPRSHLATLRRCKLFDLNLRCWTDYAGVPVTRPINQPRAVESPSPAAALDPTEREPAAP